MKEKLKSLTKEYFKLHGRKESPGLLKYLELYLEPSMEMSVKPNDILNITKQSGLNINLGDFDTTHQKIIYVLCKLKGIGRARPRLSPSAKVPLRRIALGLDSLDKYGESIEEKEILQFIYQNAQLYLKFKSVSEGSSMAHLHFLKIAKDETKRFEITVLELKEDDNLNFFVQVKPFFQNFLLLNQIHNHFLETRNPYAFLRIYHRNFLKQDDSLLYRVVLNCTTQLNENLNEWLRKGQFTDYGQEFFITKNDQSFWISFNIEPDMIPFFISEQTAKKILYIGKTCNLLVQVRSYFKKTDKSTEILSEILENIYSLPYINVLDPKFDVLIHDRLKLIDCYVKDIFLTGCDIHGHLSFCKESFFFGRNDFIEHLLFHMKEISKSSFGKRTYSFILDTAIESSFGKNNPFSSALDMCVLKDDDFSLFYRLSFPVNVIIEKDVIMIFLSIFKYLWKVKRVEHFIRRLKDRKNLSSENLIILNKWYIFLQKIFFYFSFEVIETEFSILLEILQKQTFVIDEIRIGIKKFLRSVILKIFQENNSGKEVMDGLLSVLEQECVNFRKHGTFFDDSHIQEKCQDLFKTLPFSLENTSLCNISTHY